MKVLFRALSVATAPDAVVLPKVRLANFLSLADGVQDIQYAIAMDRKCVDFLLCESDSMRPRVVVELSHSDAAKREAWEASFTTRVCKSAGITAIRIGQQEEYPIGELRRKLMPLLLDPATETKDCSDAIPAGQLNSQRETWFA